MNDPLPPADDLWPPSLAVQVDRICLDFEAAWALTMQNIRRGIREPLRPEQVLQVSRSAEFRAARQDDGRMVTGEPKAVAERLLEMKQLAEVDEIVVVTPSLDRERRIDSFRSIADAWRQVNGS